MHIITPSYKILSPFALTEENKEAIYRQIEMAGRTCYKSENHTQPGSAAKFVAAMVKSGHEAMLEHAFMKIRFTVDRGVSHELVRHREASFAQESTRYCNYSKNKFGNELTFIDPYYGLMLDPSNHEDIEDFLFSWNHVCKEAERSYLTMIDNGVSPQMARSVLPNSLKTDLVITANMREWRHILSLRAAETTGPVHPQMLEVMVPLLVCLADYMPELFGDILEKGKKNWGENVWNYLRQFPDFYESGHALCEQATVSSSSAGN